MSLTNEISLKKTEIKEKSSSLEVLFYDFLANQYVIADYENKSLSNIEKIAYNVFTKSDSDISNIIVKEQKADNSFEHHYSRNIIELSAMILADPVFEKSNIQHYLETASLKEGFILARLIPDFELIDKLKVDDSIDRLVSQAFISKDTKDFPKSVIDAITEADDLVDVFIIEKCFEALIDIHPVEDVKRKTSILFAAIDKYNDKYELKIKRRVFVFISLILILLGVIISYVIPTFWDEYNLEPLTVVTQIVFSLLLLGLSLYFFLFHKIEDNKSLLNSYINKRLNKINKRLNIDLEGINKIREDFNHD